MAMLASASNQIQSALKYPHCGKHGGVQSKTPQPAPMRLAGQKRPASRINTACPPFKTNCHFFCDFCISSAAPDCLYLHDLAIAPAGRGAGVGKMLVQAFMGALQASALHSASLIAIQGSAPYWMRFGFAPAPLTPPLAAKLQTYGQGAQYLRLVRMK